MKEVGSMNDEGRDNLYKSMMAAIRSKHARGNAIRYFKLPLILLDSKLYGGAIGQFYLLTSTLESVIGEKAMATSETKSDMICFLQDGLDLKSVAHGYQRDLEQLFGSDWRQIVDTMKTSATANYVNEIEKASDLELCSIAFILYGALVVGGGKATQKKARKVIKNCDHALFDISENMVQTRKNFKETFYQLGKKYPEHFDDIVTNAERFMSRNNDVVLSIQCVSSWWYGALTIGMTLVIGIGVARRK